MLKHICAWCNTKIKEDDQLNDPEKRISHGICDSCFGKMVAQKAEDLVTFLDTIKTPIFLVDKNVKMISANKEGQRLVRKDLDHIEGTLGGDVFDCANSKLPGGCGSTIHCKSCTVRRAVMDTMDTGKSSYEIPAFLDHGVPGEEKKVSYLISTEKKGDSVFLRIDDVGF